MRACRDAITSNSILTFHRGSILGVNTKSISISLLCTISLGCIFLCTRSSGHCTLILVLIWCLVWMY
ncbi:hypothetical protein GUJ93_ZPchr0003g16682 [Zizania palustris]|uniref:Uncharacterized protein n=1 Tax=Zizania palustris TaxID=103762 RepID=A0A8J5VY14_ZIZPA|nr:hypothetical protein GUJ93_ZPchr0003g16682 [Zizania palustris]